MKRSLLSFTCYLVNLPMTKSWLLGLYPGRLNIHPLYSIVSWDYGEINQIGWRLPANVSAFSTDLMFVIVWINFTYDFLLSLFRMHVVDELLWHLIFTYNWCRYARGYFLQYIYNPLNKKCHQVTFLLTKSIMYTIWKDIGKPS